MKRLYFLKMAILAMATLVYASPASAVLVVGWDTFTNPDAGAYSAPVTATGFSGSSLTDSNLWGQTTSGGLAGNTYGSLASPLAGAGSHLSLNTAAVGSVDFTVNNNSGDDYDLEFFHFDVGATRPGAADAWTLSVVSGAITITGDTTGVSPNGGGPTAAWGDVDSALSGTLADGQSVVFRLNFARDSTQGPGGHHQYLDNIGVSGSVVAIPEPSLFAVWTLASVGIVAARRKKQTV